MKRFASVRFDRAFASSERDVLTLGLSSVGATATSWKICGERTYATFVFEDGAPSDGPERSTALDRIANVVATANDGIARIDAPPLLILRIAPDAARLLPSLAVAFGGAGRPAGIRDVVVLDDALVVECDGRVTALSTLVALVECELTSARGRTIEPLVALDDATLVAFVASVLREPDLSPERIIETHLAAYAAGVVV